jgi:hypothetical protein
MKSSKYQVFVDTQADRKLAAHIEFLARVSEAAAARIYKEYEESLAFLKYSPASCPPYIPQKPIDAKLRYKLFGKRYRIVFEIIDNAVYAYDIQDCRQDTDKNFV